MKYALIIPDGAADIAIESLGGKTVLQAAAIPNLDALAVSGRLGRVSTVPTGMTPGSDVAIMSVLGYDPAANYSGRAPIEAAAMGIATTPTDIIFRCNLVTILDGIMEDFSGGHITTEESTAIVASLNEQLADETFRFHPGVSYRHVMVTSPASKFAGLSTTPPHDIMGQPIALHLPSGAGEAWVCELMQRSVTMLDRHPVNRSRVARGLKPANSIWLWGQGTTPTVEPFRKVYGLEGAVITAVDLVRGLGKLLDFEIIRVKGATGYIDTNYAGKAQAACEALDRTDIVVVHVEAPDEAGHNADLKAKLRAIEDIDAKIIGPVVQKLKTFDDWRIMVLPDHPTPVSVRSHTAEPVPFVIAGSNVSASGAASFDEVQAAAAPIWIRPGHVLMASFLKD